MSRQRIDRLRALANDPAATDAERALAREHIARSEATEPASAASEYHYVEVDDDLVAAMDRAMARAASVRHPGFRAARIRAAEHRLGRNAQKAWLDSRGQPLERPESGQFTTATPC